MNITDNVTDKVHGLVSARMVSASGESIESCIAGESLRLLLSGKWKMPEGGKIVSNLVVDSGRSRLARLLGGASTSTLAEVALGNCAKAGNWPTLSDENLARELINPSTSIADATFAIDVPSEISYPSSSAIFPVSPSLMWGSAAGVITIDGRGRTIFEDAGVNMTTIGADFGHRLTLNSPGQQLVFTVKRVLSTTTLELHNPLGYETPGGVTYQWRLDVSGTQLLVSKQISGDEFPAATWGPTTLITEAALRCSDSTLFARVLFSREEEGVGLLVQPSTSPGGRVDLIIDWLITF